MGGTAFASHGLYTPRMPPDVYRKVLEDVLNKLRRIYSHVQPLLEAPGKSTYGDIDVLVVSDERRPSSKDVADLLGAIKFIQTKNNSTVNYALPWPESLPASTEIDRDNISNDLQHIETDPNPRYIQLDVNHNENLEKLLHVKFLHAHGDIWMMLNTMIRPYGLMCTEDGLHVRIPELEHVDRKRSRVALTNDPIRILEYLDLDVESFWTPFASVTQLMDYVATCRFHNPRKTTAREEQQSKHDITAEDKKHSKRPMFAEWFDSYLPTHRDAPAGKAMAMTREDVLAEAKTLFGPEFARAYDRRREEGVREQEVMLMWANIRKQIPVQGEALGFAMKGLKAAITASRYATADDGGGVDGDSDDHYMLSQARQAFRDHNLSVVSQWCLANWQMVALTQEKTDKAKTRQVLEEKDKPDGSMKESHP